ncbi:unnamed protein product [Protopolystoma xenopodis]|uniref:Uncharacterized protein n=1 Tax=Protopolystoma xenopodis TaxID=117903 RepID=A0A3S4ZBS2_9PLAT|nr:unnamed protein product [Protopolystoma xenopodis]
MKLDTGSEARFGGDLGLPTPCQFGSDSASFVRLVHFFAFTCPLGQALYPLSIQDSYFALSAVTSSQGIVMKLHFQSPLRPARLLALLTSSVRTLGRSDPLSATIVNLLRRGHVRVMAWPHQLRGKPGPGIELQSHA